MRTVAPLLVLTCFAASGIGAQVEKQSLEIGTSLGVTILSAGGNTITTIGIPVDAGPFPLFARPALYATIFASPSVMIEPQVAFANISGSGDNFTMALLGAQLGYRFASAQRSSPYLGANVAFQSLSAGGGSASGVGIGGALGYRFRVGTGFAVRLEGRYRRWLGNFDGINEIGFGIGLGGII